MSLAVPPVGCAVCPLLATPLGGSLLVRPSLRTRRRKTCYNAHKPRRGRRKSQDTASLVWPCATAPRLGLSHGPDAAAWPQRPPSGMPTRRPSTREPERVGASRP